MTFTQFLGIIRARLWIFLGVLGVTVATTLAVSLMLPKQYSASTTLVVDTKGMDPVFGIMLPAQMMPGYVATQVDIIRSRKVAVEVSKAVRAGSSPVVRQQWQDDTGGRGSLDDWFADLLLKKLEVNPSRDSNVIEIAFSGTDPMFAAAIANAFAEAYQRTNLELRVEPARQSAAWFDERLQQLRRKLEEAQTRLNEYQRDKGFTAQDERLDLESSRMNELAAQYTSTQAQAADASSRLQQLNEFLARGASPETIPDVLSNPLIQNLKATLSMTEGRLQQAASQLGSNHPEVRKLEADIAGQKAKLKSEISQAAQGLRNSARIAQKREAELKSALASQKARFLQLNEGRDQMQVLVKDVESAQRAFDAAAQRFQQTNLESQASQTNVSVLTKAIPPIEPSSPRIVLNLILSIILGTMVGVGVALLVEILNRRVRSYQDLSEAIGGPTIGALLDDRATFRSVRKSKKAAAKQGRPSAAPVAA